MGKELRGLVSQIGQRRNAFFDDMTKEKGDETAQKSEKMGKDACNLSFRRGKGLTSGFPQLTMKENTAGFAVKRRNHKIFL